jgi:hypothetical protein
MNDFNPLEQIRDRIKNSEFGTVFILSDFLDLADYDSVKKSLSRLAKSGLIRRIIRGVYENPEYSTFLKENVAPSPHKAALALARNYGWTIVPNGDTALNQLGLSTQVPAEWTYVSDGPYKEYPLDKTIIRFKHTANKDISRLSYKSALLVQAIKAIGKDGFNDAQLRKIRRLMTAEEKKAILAEGKYMTNWVYELIKKICNGDMSV